MPAFLLLFALLNLGLLERTWAVLKKKKA